MVDLKKILNYSKEDSLIRDSAVLFLATSGLSAAGFFFHFYMGRVLGPASYGILGAIFSLLYIILVPFNVIQTSITNFIASFKAKNENDKINSLFRQSLKKLFLCSLILTLIFFLINNYVASFLHIPSKYLLILLPIILLSFLLPVMRGLMQGLEKFKVLGFNMTMEGIAKIVFGILLVTFGLGVSGAVMALVLSYLMPLLFAFFVLSKYLKKTGAIFSGKEVYSYAVPVLIALVLFTGLYSIDVLLVKRFFTETEAGLYVALSFLGRIIFFGTQSVAVVMFPKSVANFSVNKKNPKILKKALFLVSIFGGFATLIYFLFPRLIITILYGKNYLEISNLLGLFGLVMLILSLSYVLIFYNLSINRIKFIYFLALTLIFETLLIFIYHKTLLQVVLILLSLSIFMFVSVFFYTNYEKTINNNTGV